MSKGLLTHKRKRPNVNMRKLTDNTSVKFVIIRKHSFMSVLNRWLCSHKCVCIRLHSSEFVVFVGKF